jgi:hypothetical protein
VALHLDPLTNRHELLVVEEPPPWEAFLAFVRGKEHFVEARWARGAGSVDSGRGPRSLLSPGHLLRGHRRGQPGGFDDLEARSDRLAAAIPPGHRPASLGLDFLNAILAGDHEASYRNHRRGWTRGSWPRDHGARPARAGCGDAGPVPEAVEVARTVDPTRGEVRGWYPYWGSLAMAHHALGEFEEELEVGTAGPGDHGPPAHRPPLPGSAGPGRPGKAGGDRRGGGRCPAHQPGARCLSPGSGGLPGHVRPPGGGGTPVLPGGGGPGPRRPQREPLADRDFHLAEALLSLAAALGSEGREEALEARALHLQSSRAEPDFIDPPFGLARAAASWATPPRPGAGPTTWPAWSPGGGYGNHTWRRARIAALLGEPEEVVTLLEQAYREGLRVQFAAREDPLVMAYRDHPRVAALLRAR